MDRERADFAQATENIKKMLDYKFVPLQIPIGKENSFKGYVDLLSMKSSTFADDQSGKFEQGDIPSELQGDAESKRETLIEDIAESADELLEKYLETGELSEDDMFSGLRKAMSI